MENQLTETQLRDIAKQLGKPDGEEGLKTAARMADNNKGMVISTIDALQLANNEVVLEIGPADAPHLQYLLDKAPYLQYFGADISVDMVKQAKQKYASLTEQGQAYFYLVNGEELPFPTLRFDKVFTVNTVYFWKNPLSYLEEIRRILRPGGAFLLTFAPKDFMEKLPFTAYGFTLYSKEEIASLLENAGFKNIRIKIHTEQVQVSATEFLERPYYLVSGNI